MRGSTRSTCSCAAWARTSGRSTRFRSRPASATDAWPSKRKGRSAIYAFDPQVDLNQPLTVTTLGQQTTRWGDAMLPLVERERSLVWSRSSGGQTLTGTSSPYGSIPMVMRPLRHNLRPLPALHDAWLERIGASLKDPGLDRPRFCRETLCELAYPEYASNYETAVLDAKLPSARGSRSRRSIRATSRSSPSTTPSATTRSSSA